ncbi:M3 family metallopeptidase [Galbitalea sp. SE-J8]|uniref:M3 family metallopeptidase n=1 Tax=Galbitalea sp. SE-J8 TaxID=3054952 RepID=UPI00259D1C66|nr:M3 family metallopeptidase [Galbitalea sp. SE-J8]MDM4763264.1 M3 family metallopeptidase [Galbitalea sp. SE-J8]
MTTTPNVPLPASDWLAWADAYTREHIDAYRAAIDQLKDGSERSAAETIALLDAADLELRTASAPCFLVSEVHPDERVRDLLEERGRETVALSTAQAQDRELFAVLDAVDAGALESLAARVLERALREFRLAGVHLPDAERARVAEIEERLTQLDQDFSRVVRDDVRSIRVPASALDGLPDDYREAHAPDAEGLVTITTDYPDSVPLRTFSTDADARRALTVAYENRGWPENDRVLGEILDLRAALAALVGFTSWADRDTQRKMVGSAAGIEAFIERLRDAVSAPAASDYDELLDALRASDPAVEVVDASNAAFASELLRRERYAVDSQEARPYLHIDKVRQGLLDVTSRLFGLEYTAVDAPTWHEEVRVYDVSLTGEPLGRIHLDLHPREGKYKHAAMFDLRPGVSGGPLFEGALVCNFNRGPLEHDEVETLFHEFGHLVHGLVGSRQPYVALSGIETEWDFVEAPSQMLEEWAWDARVLRTFATDDAGEPIPTELVERMRRANGFGRAQWAARQLFYSAVSYFLHRDRPADRTAYIDALRPRYDVLRQLPDTHLQASFGHLTGYSSAYYTYLWSLVIAKDLFTAFDGDDLFAAGPAQRYRDLVLAPGGSKDAAELVEDFLGRPYAFDAFAAWLDSAAG